MGRKPKNFHMGQIFTWVVFTTRQNGQSSAPQCGPNGNAPANRAGYVASLSGGIKNRWWTISKAAGNIRSCLYPVIICVLFVIAATRWRVETTGLLSRKLARMVFRSDGLMANLRNAPQHQVF